MDFLLSLDFSFRVPIDKATRVDRYGAFYCLLTSPRLNNNKEVTDSELSIVSWLLLTHMWDFAPFRLFTFYCLLTSPHLLERKGVPAGRDRPFYCLLTSPHHSISYRPQRFSYTFYCLLTSPNRLNFDAVPVGKNFLLSLDFSKGNQRLNGGKSPAPHFLLSLDFSINRYCAYKPNYTSVFLLSLDFSFITTCERGLNQEQLSIVSWLLQSLLTTFYITLSVRKSFYCLLTSPRRGNLGHTRGNYGHTFYCLLTSPRICGWDVDVSLRNFLLSLDFSRYASLEQRALEVEEYLSIVSWLLHSGGNRCPVRT